VTILAVDPGLTACGFVVFDPTANRVLAYECLYAKGSHAEKAEVYRERLKDLVWYWQPEVVALETQHVSAVQAPRGGEGTFAGRPLPPALAAAVRASTRQDGALQSDGRNRAAERGGKNRAMLQVAELVGVLKDLCHHRGYREEPGDKRLLLVSPQQAKRALTENPKAEKGEMEKAAFDQYELKGRSGPQREWPNEHVADALGIGLGARALLREEALRD
jgi:Holliday junction resolvasome RuvABC endonuclease subunit